MSMYYSDKFLVASLLSNPGQAYTQEHSAFTRAHERTDIEIPPPPLEKSPFSRFLSVRLHPPNFLPPSLTDPLPTFFDEYYSNFCMASPLKSWCYMYVRDINYDYRYRKSSWGSKGILWYFIQGRNQIRVGLSRLYAV